MAGKILEIELQEYDAVLVLRANGERALVVCEPERDDAGVPDNVHVATGIAILLRDPEVEARFRRFSIDAVRSVHDQEETRTSSSTERIYP